jgi:hypothetical protein
MRKLRFDLTVDANALLCPNPQEFYSKAYVSEDIVDNFRTIPGVKSATKVANVLFSNLLKDSTCAFSAGNEPLGAIDIDVCPLSAMGEICRFDLETSFLSLQMAQGSNASFEVASFMAYYWDEMAKEIAAEIATIRWQGNTGSANAVLALCNGYEKKFLADGGIVDVGATATVTTANVIGEMTKVLNALPAALKFKTADLRFYVSPDIAVTYQVAAASGNTMTYITAPLALSFLGIKVVPCEGMSSKKMVLTAKTNLIYAFDGMDDSKALKAINLEDTVAEPLLRTRANLKVGFFYTNPTEIVYYS